LTKNKKQVENIVHKMFNSKSSHSRGSKYSQVRSYSDSDDDSSSDDNMEEDDFIQREIRQQQVRNIL